MRKIWFLPALMLAAISCTNTEKYHVDGIVHGKEIGKLAILERRDALLGFRPLDTAEIKDGKFKFEGKSSEPGLFFINVQDVGRSSIILEPGDINIHIYKDSLYANKVTGTYNNDQLAEFNKGSMKYQRDLIDFKKNNKERIDRAMAGQDTAAFMQLKTELFDVRMKVDSQAQVFSKKYVESHPESFISVLIVEDYLARFANEPEKIEEAYAGLSSEMKKTRTGEKIKKEIAKLKTVDVGRKAPDFAAMSPDGKKISMTQAAGRATIIDFWASWCGPCRKENPKMVALYKEFQPKGLNIIGVSLDKDAGKWKEAIAKDGLEWTQVSNLLEWDDPIARKYGVEAIPATFLLNQYGVVVGKNLQGEKLRKKLRQLLP